MIAPSVGDWIEARRGTIDNALWEQAYGLTARAAWSWQWLRDGNPIAGANDYRYQVQAADVGAQLSVTATPIDLMHRETNPVNSDTTDVVT